MPCLAHKLTLNMTKTDFMLIGSRQRLSTLTESPTFAINNFQVSQVTTAKSLGMAIDGRLDWSGRFQGNIDCLMKYIKPNFNQFPNNGIIFHID